jgi:hypothetical protein
MRRREFITLLGATASLICGPLAARAQQRAVVPTIGLLTTELATQTRLPYLDPLNHIQIELLKQHRASGVNEQVLRGIQLTINGISAGLRNSG